MLKLFNHLLSSLGYSRYKASYCITATTPDDACVGGTHSRVNPGEVKGEGTQLDLQICDWCTQAGHKWCNKGMLVVEFNVQYHVMYGAYGGVVEMEQKGLLMVGFNI